MAEVPDFIFRILDRELYEMQCKLLKCVASKYGLDYDELSSTFLKDPLQIIPPSDKKIIVTRKHNVHHNDDRTTSYDVTKCNAKLCNGNQCSRCPRPNNIFCGHHVTLMENNDGTLKYGTINDIDTTTNGCSTIKRECMARIWNRGNGGQCSKHARDGGEYCGGHTNEIMKNGKLRHGRVNEPPPNDVFKPTVRQKALYK